MDTAAFTIEVLTLVGSLFSKHTLQKSEMSEINPSVETSTVNTLTLQLVTAAVREDEILLYLETLYCFDLVRFISWHTVNSRIIIILFISTAMSGRKFWNKSFNEKQLQSGRSAYNL